VELLTPLAFILIYTTCSHEPVLLAKYIILTCFLIPIFFIDLYNRLILDIMSLPLLVIGVIFSLLPGTDIGWREALLSSIGILVILLLVAWLFEKIRHKEGIGGGDLKLLAAIAAFTGVFGLTFILLFSSVIAVIVVLLIPKVRRTGIPYGPFLAATTLIWITLGSGILQWYLSLLALE